MTREGRIKALDQRADQLRARARMLEAAEAKQRRALDTRRRILMGACVIARQDRGALSPNEVLAWLDAFLSRPGDRAAFGLPPLPKVGELP